MGNNISYPKTPEFQRAAASFSSEELYLLRLIFKDLADRSPLGLTKDTFLEFFPLKGLWGEKVWKEFDALSIGSIDYGLFIIGLNKFCKCQEGQKIQFLFDFYDGDRDGFIDKEDMLQMLYSYSKDDLTTITNDIFQKVQKYSVGSNIFSPARRENMNRSMRSGSLAMVDQNNSGLPQPPGIERRGSLDVLESDIYDKNYSALRGKKIVLNVDNNRSVEVAVPQMRITPSFQRLGSMMLDTPEEDPGTTRADALKRDMHFQHLNEHVKDLRRRSTMNLESSARELPQSHVIHYARIDRPATVIQPVSAQKAGKVIQRESSSASHIYSTALNFQNKVRNYASTVIKEYQDKGRGGRLTREEFKEWILQHPVVLKLFSDSFHIDVWGTNESILKMVDPERKDFTNGNGYLPKCAYCNNEPLMCGYIYKKGRRIKTWKLRYCELREQFLFYFKKKGDPLPRGIYYMGGVFIEPANDLDKSKKYGLVISHKNPEYSQHRLYFASREEYESWMMHFKNFTVTSITDLFELEEKIGSGKFSIVYRARDKKLNNKETAVKVIHKDSLEEDEREFLISETAIMKLLSHPHIIKLYETIETPTHLYIVTEIVRDGDLFEYIKSKAYLEEYEASLVMKQLLEAFAYLQGMSVVHRDIKPENIMITLNETKDFIKVIKIIDFGFAQIVRPDQLLHESCGTPNYIAPEVLLNEGYSKYVDNWSLGVLLYFMLTGKLPFDATSMDVIFRKILIGEVEMISLHWKNVSEEGLPSLNRYLKVIARDLIKKFLVSEPEKRIEIEAALQHPWITGRENLKALIGVNRNSQF